VLNHRFTIEELFDKRVKTDLEVQYRPLCVQSRRWR